MSRKLKWTVEFEVDETWVADGFYLTDDRALDMLSQDLSFAYGHELGAKVTRKPDLDHVAILQGYKSKTEMKRKNPNVKY